VQRLIVDGVKRSATFADLIAAVNTSDVIVYVETVDRLAPRVAGHLLLVPVVNGQRYLRIQVRSDLTPDEAIAILGHELQHALEVAAAPDVRDQQGLVRLYQRIGERGAQEHAFDTLAAQQTGRQVKTELAG
jgi:hypothetical protein